MFLFNSWGGIELAEEKTMEFSNKVVLVTGSARGIGEAIAARFAERGAAVVAVDVNEEGARRCAAGIVESGGKAIAIKVDVTSRTDVEAMVAKVLEEFGGVDVLVNNAGFTETHPFIEEDEEYWDRVIAINLKGPILCSRAVLDSMIERKRGKIINVGSDAGRVGMLGQSVYAAAKGGVIALTKSLAREVARYKISVNCICPGPTDTPLLADQSEKVIEAMTRQIPFRRVAKPDEIADAILFLASSGADYITGQVISVSGGLTMVD